MALGSHISKKPEAGRAGRDLSHSIPGTLHTRMVTDGEGRFWKEVRQDKQRQLQHCHRDQACQHPTPSAPQPWCHSPQQELRRVIEPEHVVIVLHIVLVQKRVQLFQLKQERSSRLRTSFSHHTSQLPSEGTLNTFCVATAMGTTCSRVPATSTSPALGC